MKKKKETKEEESNLIDFIFPETDILFKNVLSVFITYYILDILFKILQIQNGIWGKFFISILILWTVMSFCVFHFNKLFNKLKK